MFLANFTNLDYLSGDEWWAPHHHRATPGQPRLQTPLEARPHLPLWVSSPLPSGIIGLIFFSFESDLQYFPIRAMWDIPSAFSWTISSLSWHVTGAKIYQIWLKVLNVWSMCTGAIQPSVTKPLSEVQWGCLAWTCRPSSLFWPQLWQVTFIHVRYLYCKLGFHQHNGVWFVPWSSNWKAWYRK